MARLAHVRNNKRYYKMDIVAIMGSPRKHGNTNRLLDEMIKEERAMVIM